MRLLDTALGGLMVMACAGCPGTIADPASFEELGQASRVDSGSPAQDAAGADAGAWDAAEPPPPDAGGTSDDAGGPAEDAGWSMDSSAPPPDAGEPQPEGGEPGADADVGCDFEALITAKCGSSGCHGAPAVSNGLDLTSPDMATRLGRRRGSGACSSYLMIDTAQPEKSVLYLKVTPDACGSRMPLGGTLTDGEQACILRWLENVQ